MYQNDEKITENSPPEAPESPRGSQNMIRRETESASELDLFCFYESN